jgi:hypothetical protein
VNSLRTVAIPEELCRAAERKFAHRFGTLDELLAELLKELLRDDALVNDENEQRVIEERLKGLGYI